MTSTNPPPPIEPQRLAGERLVLEKSMATGLAPHLNFNAEAKKIVARAVAELLSYCRGSEPRILSRAERVMLANAIGTVRNVLADAHPDSLNESRSNGQDALMTASDKDLLVEAFYRYSVIPHASMNEVTALLNAFLRLDVQALLGAADGNAVEQIACAARAIRKNYNATFSRPYHQILSRKLPSQRTTGERTVAEFIPVAKAFLVFAETLVPTPEEDAPAAPSP